jgi:hypothetical protein
VIRIRTRSTDSAIKPTIRALIHLLIEPLPGINPRRFLTRTTRHNAILSRGRQAHADANAAKNISGRAVNHAEKPVKEHKGSDQV